MPTEDINPEFADIDLWPTGDAVMALLEGHISAARIVKPQVAALALAADEAAERLADPTGRLIYVGAGTSGRIAVLDGVELEPTFGWLDARVVYLIAGGMTALATSVEGAEDDSAAAADRMSALEPASGDVVIGVAASGRTPFTLAAIDTARLCGALTIAIANNPQSPLLAAAEHAILLDTGAEAIAGSTRMKAGTAQKIALNLLSTAVMLRLGRVYKGMMVDMRVSNRKLHRRAIGMVGEIAGVEPARAKAALDRANGEIKLAVLIARGETLERSAAMLAAAGGNLRIALGRDDEIGRQGQA